ncbi:conserved domain protein [Ruminococcus albus 8]|uniref:Conserved domain protein n=1 Tax=Ruminococcus albus 8 TaxID=246199 RepID=E9SE00_RUMAL|nr:conserved domain protein [Ruminococcus albus 8]
MAVSAECPEINVVYYSTARCIFTPLTIYHLKKEVRYGIIRISSGNEGDNLIFVSNYAAYLPTEEELKRELMKDEFTKLDDE